MKLLNLMWAVVAVMLLGCDTNGTTSGDRAGAKALTFVDSSTGLPSDGQWRHGMTFYDLNRDGHIDILAPPPRKGRGIGYEKPVVWYGNGKGGWSQAFLDVPSDVDYDYGGITVSDFDGDGVLDLALAMHGKGLKAFKGEGDGRYVNFSVGLPPAKVFSSRALVSGDFNKDGRQDIAAVSEGKFTNGLPAPTGAWVCSAAKAGWKCNPIGDKEAVDQLYADQIIAGDINGDGNKDIVLASLITYKDLVVWCGDGRGGFTLFRKGLPPQAKHAYQSVALADINRDGRDDLIAALVGAGIKGFSGLKAFLGGPDAFKDISEGLPTPRVFLAVGAGDLDGDGSAEIIAGTEEGGLRVFSYDGKRWNEMRVSGLPEKGMLRTWNVYCVDLNKDGRKDIAVNYGSDINGTGGVRVFLNNTAEN